MTLIYARNINLGEQKTDGTYEIVRPDGTICEPCIIENRWGYTTLVDDTVGKECELCGSAG